METTLKILNANVAPSGTDILSAGAVTSTIEGQASIIPMSTLRNADGSDAMLNLVNLTESNIKMLPNETSSYFTGATIIPTTLTAGNVYFSIRNPSSTKKIKIKKIEIIMYFVGTAGATRSTYVLQKGTGCIGSTGTTILAPESGNTTNPASVADIKISPTGVTLTGATFVLNRNVCTLGHPNQLTSNISYDRDLENAPLILSENEVLALRSEGALVAGSTVHISLRWTEE